LHVSENYYTCKSSRGLFRDAVGGRRWIVAEAGSWRALTWQVIAGTAATCERSFLGWEGRMDWLNLVCWLALAAIHASPAAVLFRPDLTETLYGASPTGSTGLLMIHRGALFLAVVVVSSFAAFAPEARRAASLLVAISVVGFLLVYAAAGAPAGPLRTIAVVDAVALLPLALVSWRAWRPAGAPW
jgi:hypothetical protein